MSVSVAEARPPYVTFEARAEEDRAQSMAAGHPILVDVHYAYVTPQGSKDRIERLVRDWFPQLQQSVQEGRYEASWLANHKASYEAWKAGQDDPLTGMSVKQWPVATVAQVKMLLNIHVRTVEDLAAANEETLNRLGMGGRMLKSKAIEWLANAKDGGKTIEEISSLKVENETLKATITNQQLQMEKLASQVEQLLAKETKE